MADIFLSYKREDLSIARAVAKDLEAEGFTVFFDVKIDVGDSWDRKIESELEAAGAVVVLWSPTSRDSEWVRIEASYAKDRGILFPAIIVGCSIPLAFSLAQTANLIDRRANDRAHVEWRRLVDAISVKARHIQANQSANQQLEGMWTWRDLLPQKASDDLLDPLGAEAEHWRMIRHSRDPAAFRDYLYRYGAQGAFSELAEFRLKQLLRR